MILQWAVMTVIPPILDVIMDYINGFRSFTGSNLSRVAWSLGWAMFINIIITPMLAVAVYRDDRIEKKLAKIVGKVLRFEKNPFCENIY